MRCPLAPVRCLPLPLCTALPRGYTSLGASCMSDTLQLYGLRKWESGDIIGCGLVRLEGGGHGIFFTHNGHYLGLAFEVPTLPSARFVVGMRGQWPVHLHTNFGVCPFEFQPTTWQQCQVCL